MSIVVPGGLRGLRVLEVVDSLRPGMVGRVQLSEIRSVEDAGRYDVEVSWLDGPRRSELQRALADGGDETLDPARVKCVRVLSLTGVVGAILGGAERCLLVHSPALTSELHAELGVENHLEEARRLLEVAHGCAAGEGAWLRTIRRYSEELRFDHIPDPYRIWLLREGLELARAALTV